MRPRTFRQTAAQSPAMAISGASPALPSLIKSKSNYECNDPKGEHRERWDTTDVEVCEEIQRERPQQ